MPKKQKNRRGDFNAKVKRSPITKDQQILAVLAGNLKKTRGKNIHHATERNPEPLHEPIITKLFSKTDEDINMLKISSEYKEVLEACEKSEIFGMRVDIVKKDDSSYMVVINPTGKFSNSPDAPPSAKPVLKGPAYPVYEGY